MIDCQRRMLRNYLLEKVVFPAEALLDEVERQSPVIFEYFPTTHLDAVNIESAAGPDRRLDDKRAILRLQQPPCIGSG